MDTAELFPCLSEGDGGASYGSAAPPLSQPPCLKTIPLSYPSPEAYLRGMQLHGSAEYYAAVQVGLRICCRYVGFRLRCR